MPFVTRLAPSPTGRLHLGNARTFLVNWLMARQADGRIILRIEDLDRDRVKPGLVDAARQDLEWLGLDWDEGPVHQSDRLERYQNALERLQGDGRVYGCVCSRKEIRAASAPHAGDEGPTYPGTCRGRFRDEEEARTARGRPPAWRFLVPDGAISFDDRFCGQQSIDPSRVGGDFVVRSVDGTFAYQLAVTVDDAEMGVTEVVRGDDLLTSAPRQILLYHALGATPPRFTHLPLVLDRDGQRMAKRHGDTELSELRRAGIEAGRVRALLASWCGIEDAAPVDPASELIARFRLENVPRTPIQVTALPW